MELKDLKALAYDLLVQKQNIEAQLVQVNNKIAEILNSPKKEATPPVAKKEEKTGVVENVETVDKNSSE